MSNIDQAIEFFKEKVTKIEQRLASIEEKQLDFTKRFIILDTKQSITDYIVKNWWKLAAFLIPFLFMLGELSLYIRKLVP